MKKLFSLFKNFTKKTHLNVVLGILLGLSLAFLAFNAYFIGKIYPGVYINDVYVGGLRVNQALSLLSDQAVPEKVILKTENQTFELETKTFGAKYDFEKTGERAYGIYRTGNIVFDFWDRTVSLFKKKKIGLELVLSEGELEKTLSQVSGSIYIEPVQPHVGVVSGEVFVERGRAGIDLDKKLLRAQIGAHLSTNSSEAIQLPVFSIDPSLTESQAVELKKRAEGLLGKSFELTHEFQTFYLTQDDILSFLLFNNFDNEKIAEKISEISKNINRDPQDSRFVFEEGRVKEFAPSRDGVLVETEELLELITNTLARLETSQEDFVNLAVPVKTTAPKITTEEVNNLGIRELVGRGSSTFRGSIPSRVHNVGHAASKFNGVLVKPGEVMSFNNTLGDVSALTGYQQAYVIKDGRTVLGDGGGVCQVSTTLFRAILNAGLPVTERRAHSYRVGYYEQDVGPGLDATVFAPTTDLKFVNDTPGHLLVQTYFDSKAYSLVFEIYGTSDGRIAKTTKPVTGSVVPPPEDLYQDDPTLPVGVVKQIEHKAWGAKTTFNYTVERGGEKIYEKTFVSNYRPWQAVYLRGTGPVQQSL